MSFHLHREIDELKKRILGLSALVEESVYKAVKAVEARDEKLAREVIEGDQQLDMVEVEVEEECLKILALHQPVAADLRFIVAVLKINNDLERIGDLAVNIASRAIKLSAIKTQPEALIDFQDLESKVQQMLRRSLESLVNLNEEIAKSVCSSDDAIDDINRSIHKQVIQATREHPNDVERFIILLSVSKNLERIADHATNIAEDVLYMIRGEIVRHSKVQ
ncbi:MAG: phosphate signaling complex protein PhoU [Proteobacteria bacterium]|nr:phosphate signaling complex protein PhoU [Pseudomonadota bacterium]